MKILQRFDLCLLRLSTLPNIYNISFLHLYDSLLKRNRRKKYKFVVPNTSANTLCNIRCCTWLFVRYKYKYVSQSISYTVKLFCHTDKPDFSEWKQKWNFIRRTKASTIERLKYIVSIVSFGCLEVPFLWGVVFAV